MSLTTPVSESPSPVPSLPDDNPVARLAALTDLVTPYAIRVAATLRLSDLIEEGTTRVGALAERTRTNADALGRLLEHLNACGLVEETQAGEYALTDLGRILGDNHPAHTRAWLDLEGGMGRSDLALSGLLATVRTGEPSYAAMFGAPFWEDLAAHPYRAAAFDTLMAVHLAGVAETVDHYDWSGVRHVVDVGGGSGNMLTRILKARPDMRGTLVELASSAENARRQLSDAGLSDRCDVVSGSFFEPLPENADVYLLSFVLHDWNDRQAAAIVHRCAEAAGERGRVLVLERLKGEGRSQAWATAMDLRMLLTLGGRERTLDDFRSIAATEGIPLRTAERTATGVWLLTFAANPDGAGGPAPDLTATTR